eukprot:5274502-Pyramimonas_sp.AAC.1
MMPQHGSVFQLLPPNKTTTRRLQEQHRGAGAAPALHYYRSAALPHYFRPDYFLSPPASWSSSSAETKPSDPPTRPMSITAPCRTRRHAGYESENNLRPTRPTRSTRSTWSTW